MKTVPITRVPTWRMVSNSTIDACAMRPSRMSAAPTPPRTPSAAARIAVRKSCGSVASSASVSASAGVSSPMHSLRERIDDAAVFVEEQRALRRHRARDGARDFVGLHGDVAAEHAERERFDDGDVARREQRVQQARLHGAELLARGGQHAGIRTGDADGGIARAVDRLHDRARGVGRGRNHDRLLAALHQKREVGVERRAVRRERRFINPNDDHLIVFGLFLTILFGFVELILTIAGSKPLVSQSLDAVDAAVDQRR